MSTENQVIEYKSLRKVQTGDAGFKDLSTTCVCLANSQGGEIFIGFDDKTKLPPVNQLITDEIINETITRLRSLCFNTGLNASGILTHPNGGQFFVIDVFPSLKSIATTSDGKIYLRVGDQCQPVRNEDIFRLANEKEAFQWELVSVKSIKVNEANPVEIEKFVADIRNSVQASDYIKSKTAEEILEHYNLTEKGFLTNLGILWLGNPSQRARLSYPITVQYIVYDSNEAKIRKETWHDYSLNPKDLILDIEKKAVELTYFH